MWTLKDALNLCVLVEERASMVDWHVALTGGCLYKDGYRKDLDLVFYPHTHKAASVDALLENLKLSGFTINEIFSSIVKASYDSKSVDLFIVERMDLWNEGIKNALGSRGYKRGYHGSGY